MINACLILKKVRIQIVVKMSGEVVAAILGSQKVLLIILCLMHLKKRDGNLDKVILKISMALTPKV